MTRHWPVFISTLTLAATAAVWGQASVAQRPAQAPPTTGRALLAGQVVEAGTTRPIAGALVTLGGTPSRSESPVVFSFDQAAIPGGNRQTVTNNQGHFLFADLPPGTYSVQAEKSGFVPGGHGKSRATGLPQTVMLGEDDRVADLRIALSKYATIGGRVLDEAGEPIIGVTVLAMRRRFDNGLTQFETAAFGMADETDDRGEFRLATLISGDYILSIRSTQATVPMSVVDTWRQATSAGTVADFNRELRASGSPNVGSTTGGVAIGDQFFQPTSSGSRVMTPPPPGADGTLFVYPLQFFPSARSPSDATIVALRSGEARFGIDFHLNPVATSSVSGVVTGPSGPVPNLGLGLVHTATSLVSDTFFETATTVTDARGGFTFLGVPAGQYLLRALKIPVAPIQPGVKPAPVGAVGRTFQIPDGPTLWESLPVTVGRTAISGLAVSLKTGFRVSGRIEFERSAAKPAAEATSRLFDARFEPQDDRSPALMSVSDLLSVACDADGRLSSYELPPGKYYVTASTLPGWTFKSAMLDGRDVSLVPFDLRDDVTTLVITYTDRPSALGGTVRSPKGTADGAAQVLVFPAEAASATYVGSMRGFKAARASASGAYRFPILPAGEYLVVAIADEAAAEFPSLTLVRSLARLATRVTIGDAENKTQDLTTVTIR